MFKKILVPLDGSEAAETALQVAKYLAEGSGGELLVVRVTQAAALAESLEAPLPSDLLESEQKHCSDYLAQVVGNLCAEGFSARSAVLGAADAGEAILEEAVHRPVDLICMSSHGKTGGSRYFTGTVAEKVARFAPCPVMLIGRMTPARSR